MSGENLFKYSLIFSIRALTEFTFQELMIIYREKETPQPQEDLDCGLLILKDSPISSLT